MTEPAFNIMPLLGQLGVGGVIVGMWFFMWIRMDKRFDSARARDIETYNQLRETDRQFLKMVVEQVEAQAQINNQTADSLKKAAADLVIVTERLRKGGA